MRLPPQLLSRKKEAHKGEFGHLVLVAGSQGMNGAVFLAAKAALRSGCGLVTMVVPVGIHSIIKVQLPEALSLPVSQTEEGTISQEAQKEIDSYLARRKVDALAIGPGLSGHPQTQEFIFRLIERIKVPSIWDADALNALASRKEYLEKIKNHPQSFIFTPHPGEFSRLIEKSAEYILQNRLELAKEFSNNYNVCLVLKGYHSLVIEKNQVYENKTGNPGMASGGCGDVLTGIIGSFLAQGLSSFEAAKYATYIHGLSGDLAAKSQGQLSLIASDLIEYLPQAILKSS